MSRVFNPEGTTPASPPLFTDEHTAYQDGNMVRNCHLEKLFSFLENLSNLTSVGNAFHFWFSSSGIWGLSIVPLIYYLLSVDILVPEAGGAENQERKGEGILEDGC
jgi:hypothetical protein